MQLTPHFHLSEFTVSQTAVRRRIDNEPPAQVIAQLADTAEKMEQVRHLLGDKPIIVTSGYRSPKVNKAVGGSRTSAHLTGHAVDFICPGYGRPIDICHKLVSSLVRFDQLIEEGNWVHISFDPRMRGEVLTLLPSGSYRMGLRPL